MIKTKTHRFFFSLSSPPTLLRLVTVLQWTRNTSKFTEEVDQIDTVSLHNCASLLVCGVLYTIDSLFLICLYYGSRLNMLDSNSTNTYLYNLSIETPKILTKTIFTSRVFLMAQKDVKDCILKVQCRLTFSFFKKRYLHVKTTNTYVHAYLLTQIISSQVQVPTTNIHVEALKR